MSSMREESAGSNHDKDSSIHDRLRIHREAILEREGSIDKKLEEVKLELKDVRERLESKEMEIEGLLNRNVFIETELEDLREDNEKLASDLMKSFQERSSINKKLSTANFSDEVFLAPPTEDDILPQSNIEELNERMSALEQLMKTACKDMKEHIEENEAAIERISFASTQPTAIQRISTAPAQPTAISLQHSNNDVDPIECQRMDAVVPPSGAEEIEKTECIMREKLEKMKSKVEEDEQKIDLLLKDVNNHSEEVSFITERQHEMDDWDQSIQLHQKHCMEPDYKGGLEEKIHVMQELQEKLRQSKEMAAMYKRVKNAEQFVSDNVAAIKETVEENISGWNEVQLKMDQCQGQIVDLKQNQQRLLDRDGTSRLIDQIAAAESLLNTELTRIKGVVESDCVDTQLIQEIQVKVMETDGLIQDNVDKIKQKVEEDFGSLNALQEMLHLLLMRQDHLEERDDVTKLVDRVDAVAVLLNNEISRVTSILRRSDGDNPSTRECTRRPTINERVFGIENIMSGDFAELKEKMSTAEEFMQKMDHQINRNLAPLREELQKESQSVASLVHTQKTNDAKIQKVSGDIIELREKMSTAEEFMKKMDHQINRNLAPLREELQKESQSVASLVQTQKANDAQIQQVSGDIMELREKMSTAEEFMQKMDHQINRNLAPLREELQKESQSVASLVQTQKTNDAQIQRVVNTEFAKLRREIEKVRDKAGNDHTVLTKIVDEGHKESMGKLEERIMELSEKFGNSCTFLDETIENVRERVVNDHAALTKMMEKGHKACMDEVQDRHIELSKQIESDCTIVDEKLKKVTEIVENDIFALGKVVDESSNKLWEVEKQYEKLSEEVESSCTVVNEKLSCEVSDLREKMEYQDQQYIILTEKIDNDYKGLTAKVENENELIRKKTDQDYKELAEKVDNDRSMIIEKTKQYYKELHEKVEKDCNAIKDNTSKVYNASIEKIDGQEKQFDMIMEKVESGCKELMKNLESQFNLAKEESDKEICVLAEKLEHQKKEYMVLGDKQERNYNKLNEKLESQHQLTEDKIVTDNQAVNERVTRECNAIKSRLGKESEDLKLFTEGLINDFVNRSNSAATYSEEDMQAIRHSHEGLSEIRVQMAEMTEKISLAEEFTQHNLSAIGEKMGHMNEEVSRLLEHQRMLEEKKVVERLKDTEELLQDGLKKTKEELERHEGELLAVKQWQTHVGEREEIAKLPSKMNGIEEKTMAQVKEQLVAAMSDIKKETEKILVESSKGVKEKDLKDLKSEVKRLDDLTKRNYTSLCELHPKCEEQMKAVKEWQKSVKEESERAELQK